MSFWSIMLNIATNVLLALIIVIIGLILGRISAKLVGKLLILLEADKFLKRAGFEFSAKEFCSKICQFTCILIAIILALKLVDLFWVVSNVLLICLMILLVIAIILNVYSMIPNFIAGLILRYKKIIETGKIITLSGITGEIINLGILEVKIKTKNNDLFSIPNRTILGNFR